MIEKSQYGNLCIGSLFGGNCVNNKTKICDNCGATCDIRDTYCKKCLQSFLKQDETSKPVIEGIDNTELKKFLGKNSEYYLEKFAKAKNKNVFLQLNFSALLFGPNWFFYRKMKKLAIMYVAILFMLSLMLSVALPIIFEADIDTYYDAKKAYNDYDGEVLIFKEGTTTILGRDPIYQEVHDNLDNAQRKIILIDFLIGAPVFVVNIMFRLLGNFFYKKHIISNINTTEGGTSGKAAFWGIIATNVVAFIISLLLLLIPAVYRFQHAIATLYYWL